MRQIGNRALWIGNSGDLRNARAILDAEIEAVIELADSEVFAELPRSLMRCRFPLSDGGDNSEVILLLAVQTVAALLRARIPTLICCSAGMSRSVCLTAGAISTVENLPLSEALSIVIKDGPADVSPNLLNQFQLALIGA